MKYKSMLCMAFCILTAPSIAQADEILQWVDEQGVTHFGDAQFAPAGQGDNVRLNPANRMNAVDVGVLSRKRNRTQANLTVLERKQVSNPRGFRGFAGRSPAQRGRRY